MSKRKSIADMLKEMNEAYQEDQEESQSSPNLYEEFSHKNKRRKRREWKQKIKKERISGNE